MIQAHVAVHDGIRRDVTEVLPEALDEKWEDSVASADEDRARTAEHVIQPFLPSVRLTLRNDITEDEFSSFLEELNDERTCTYELREWSESEE